MTLSGDRASAVVETLVNGHEVSPDRLKAHGIDPLAQLASNTEEAGRGKNRRVVLVQRQLNTHKKHKKGQFQIKNKSVLLVKK